MAASLLTEAIAFAEEFVTKLDDKKIRNKALELSEMMEEYDKNKQTRED